MEEEKENLKQEAKEKRWKEEVDQTGWFEEAFVEEQMKLESQRGSVNHIEIVTLEKLKNRSEFLIEQLGVQMSNFRQRLREESNPDEIFTVLTKLRGAKGIEKWEGRSLMVGGELRGWLKEIVKIMKRRFENLLKKSTKHTQTKRIRDG